MDVKCWIETKILNWQINQGSETLIIFTKMEFKQHFVIKNFFGKTHILSSRR